MNIARKKLCHYILQLTNLKISVKTCPEVVAKEAVL